MRQQAKYLQVTHYAKYVTQNEIEIELPIDYRLVSNSVEDLCCRAIFNDDYKYWSVIIHLRFEYHIQILPDNMVVRTNDHYVT